MTNSFVCDIISALLGGLAQLGEHLPYKQRVTGSSPVPPTKNLILTNEVFYFLLLTSYLKSCNRQEKTQYPKKKEDDNMKKYIAPEMEVTALLAEDILSASDNTGEFDGEWVPIG